MRHEPVATAPEEPVVQPALDLEAIAESFAAMEREGRFTVDAFWKSARKNPLHTAHNHYKWDVEEAAIEHWRFQTRQLKRRVTLEITYEDVKFVVPKYHRDPRADGDEQGYVSIPQLRHEPESATALINMEFDRAVASLKRAADLAAALNMPTVRKAVANWIGEIKKTTERLERIASKKGGK
jgi:hypothetical protein